MVVQQVQLEQQPALADDVAAEGGELQRELENQEVADCQQMDIEAEGELSVKKVG